MADLFDIVVRRQIYVEGLKHKKGAEFAATLAKLRTELYNRLSAFPYAELGDATKLALNVLIADLRKIATGIFDPYLRALIEWLQRYVNVDVDLLAGLFAEAVPARAERVKDSDPDKVWAMAVNAPMAATGTLPRPFLLALLPALYVKLERMTFQTYANAGTKDDLIKAIVGSPNSDNAEGLLRQLRQQGDAATNTVLQHLANQIGDSLGAKIAGFYEWVSVLDAKTTAICWNRDGNRYSYGKGPIPPAHVNCRSTIVPITSFDAPKTPTSYPAWLRGQPDEFIADALDGRRGDIYERSRPITLNEYGAKAGLIRA